MPPFRIREALAKRPSEPSDEDELGFLLGRSIALGLSSDPDKGAEVRVRFKSLADADGFYTMLVARVPYRHREPALQNTAQIEEQE